MISFTGKLKALAYGQAFSDLYGVALDPEDRPWHGHKESQVVKYWSEPLNITVDVDPVFERKLFHYRTLVERDLEPRRDAVALLQSPGRQNVPVAIVTNSAKTVTRSILRRIGVWDLVHVLVCFDDVAAPKPSSTPYLRAREFLGLNSKEVLVFEDVPAGGLTTTREGMPLVAVARQKIWSSISKCYRYVLNRIKIIADIKKPNNRVFL